MVVVFFFKQKTAYEMRISDWSSDVCSSDLMVIEDLRLSKILTKQAFENAIVTNGAIGGSTNAVVHLLAIAGRVGIDLGLDDWDRLGREIPCLLNLMPSGEHLKIGRAHV